MVVTGGGIKRRWNRWLWACTGALDRSFSLASTWRGLGEGSLLGPRRVSLSKRVGCSRLLKRRVELL